MTNDNLIVSPSFRPSSLNQAVIEWLSSYTDWSVFATLTFRHDVNEAMAHLNFKTYCREVAQLLGYHFQATWGWGPQLGGRIHFHALFGSFEEQKLELPLADARLRWGFGRAKIDPVQSVSRAVEYVRQHHGWIFPVVVCPRLRRCRIKGYPCSETDSPWPSPGEGLLH